MSLNRIYRLSKKNDFLKAYKLGVYWRSCNLRIVALPSADNVHMFGVVATRKSGCAAERNKYKRRVKNWLRLNLEKISPFSTVVISAASKDLVSLKYCELESLLNKWLKFYLAKKHS